MTEDAEEALFREELEEELKLESDEVEVEDDEDDDIKANQKRNEEKTVSFAIIFDGIEKEEELRKRADSSFSIYSDTDWNKRKVKDYTEAYRQSSAKPAIGSHILHYLDVILNEFEEDDISDPEALRTKIMKVKGEVYDELKKTGMQMQIMKGQLERRGSLMDKQREAFLKELNILREELFQKRINPQYKPQNVVLHDWSQRASDDEVTTPTVKKAPVYQLPRTTYRAETEEKLAMSLKSQTQKVSDTLSNLRKLEHRRKLEIEALRKSREDAEKLRKQLLKQAEKHMESEKKLSEMQMSLLLKAEEDKKNANRPISQNSSRPPSHLSVSERLDQDTIDDLMFNNVDTLDFGQLDQSIDDSVSDCSFSSGTPSVSARTFLQRDIADFKMKDIANLLQNPDSAQSLLDIGDEDSLHLLEHQIHEFHQKFKDLFDQMNQIKQRVKFYNDQKQTPKEADVQGPEGFLTLVFTDVQDSTRLWESNLDAMSEAIKLHNEVMRNMLRFTDGFEVKTEGDAFMCAFAKVEDAVEFTLQAQMALVDADWPLDIVGFESGREEYDEDGSRLLYRGLRVRMGIHAGEPIVQKDPITGRNDYFGPVVNRAARIAGQAVGGQIVISNIVWEHIQDQLEKFRCPVWTKYIGEVSLKGMDDPEILRLILPFELCERRFSALPPQETTSMQALEEKLLRMQEEHANLEAEREVIHNQIQYKLRIKALEDTMNEKDNVINYLKNKLEEVKRNYQESVKQSDEKKKKVLSKETIRLQKDIELVMDKYETMRTQYTEMKESYEDVVNVFDLKLKTELTTFREELTKMSSEVIPADRGNALSTDWGIERFELHKQLELKEKLLREQENKINKLKNDIAISEMTSKVENTRSVAKRDMATSISRWTTPVDTPPSDTIFDNHNHSNNNNNNTNNSTTSSRSQTPQTPVQEKLHTNPNNVASTDGYYSPTHSDHHILFIDNGEKATVQETTEDTTMQVDSKGPPATNVRPNTPAPKIFTNGSETKRKNFTGLTLSGFKDSAVSQRDKHEDSRTGKADTSSSLVVQGKGNSSPTERKFSATPLRTSSVIDTSITFNDITQILKDAIKDAIVTARTYRDFDWKIFIKGQRVKNVDAINSLPGLSSYLRKMDLTTDDLPPNKLLKVWDEARKEPVTVSVDELKKWGVTNANKFMPPKVSNKVLSPVSKPQKPKVSYSRLLENLGGRQSRKSVPHDEYISQWDPLGSPFRRVKRTKAGKNEDKKNTQEEKHRQTMRRSQSAPLKEESVSPTTHHPNVRWSDQHSQHLQNQSRDRSPQFQHATKQDRILLPEIRQSSPIPDSKFNDRKKMHIGTLPRSLFSTEVTKEERRDHILRMLSEDRNEQLRSRNSDYSETSSPSPTDFSIMGRPAKNMV